MKASVSIAAIAAILAGCTAARSTVYEGIQVKPAKPIAGANAATNAGKLIFISKGNLPAEVKVEVVGEIRANQSFYGNTERVYASMAAKARQTGADAVVNVNVKYRVAGLGWATPSVAGVGVKIIDDGGVDIKKLEGMWK